MTSEEWAREICVRRGFVFDREEYRVARVVNVVALEGSAPTFELEDVGVCAIARDRFVGLTDREADFYFALRPILKELLNGAGLLSNAMRLDIEMAANLLSAALRAQFVALTRS